MSRQGIIFSQYVKRIGRIQRKLRQTEDKTHRDDLYKLTKKIGIYGRIKSNVKERRMQGKSFNRYICCEKLCLI